MRKNTKLTDYKQEALAYFNNCYTSEGQPQLYRKILSQQTKRCKNRY